MTTLSVPNVRQHLKNFELEKLFLEELGWDRHNAKMEVPVDGKTYALRGFAEKRGVQIFQCLPDGDGKVPDYNTRRKIEKEVTKRAYEHMIVFVDADRTTQIWQWVARQPGQPAAFREHAYHPRHQSGDALIQKFSRINIPLSEEESLDLLGTVHKLKDAFDRDRVTRRFYDRFKKEHDAFLKFIKGITAQGDREWYASLMLNRLMFVYFIQKKGFLDGDSDYLRHRLKKVQDRKGKGRFLTFYRYFLLTLFQQGFSQQPEHRELDAELTSLLGRVPYLNGGLFDLHELEEANPDIDVPDEAFEKLFDFFDQYDWHLDTRPIRDDREINPDVLGYIFEKYINQKQMGAYYTKEDITDYISKNTIIPYLFDEAKKKCEVAFQPGSALWRLLRDDPDRYIYPAVRRGVIDEDGEVIPLPPEIAAGQENVQNRQTWNQAADPDYALPTESWREHVARRQRCLELRQKLRAGEVHEINDLITYNLDIRQFADDVIAACEGPELLRAFWQAIRGVTVLDPTCGSGAFLFAALGILQPLYEACLDRMQAFIEDWNRSPAGHSSKKFEDFRKVLAEIDRHPNRDYFILKSIIVGNLYGVDIMEEAVEICKLRLFLKLVAQVDRIEHLEPLPDIDFNIRPGNTLIGFARLEDVQKTILGKLADESLKAEVDRIAEDAEIVDRAFQRFHEMQTEQGMDARDFADQKQELRLRISGLTRQLNRYLAAEYGIDPDKPKEFEKWRSSHQPFHWFAEFYGIMASGGFGVIIGNPPYVEYSKVRKVYRVKSFATEQCGNLYAICTERSYSLLAHEGRFGFIVQAPIVSTQRMNQVRDLLRQLSGFIAFSTYDDRPSKLFDGMNHCRLAIILSEKHDSRLFTAIRTTQYHKWYKDERKFLFDTIAYTLLSADWNDEFIPKFRSETEMSIYKKITAMPKSLADMLAPRGGKYKIYYKITGVGHWFSFTLRPPKFWRDGREESSSRESSADFDEKIRRDTAFCCLCSSLHYWVYQARTNCRDFNPSDLRYLPVPEVVAGGLPDFSTPATNIMNRLDETSEIGSGSYTVGGSVRFQKFKPKMAKELFDNVDRLLAKHYGFTDEELDFLINYDIKYRMGLDDEGDE